MACCFTNVTGVDELVQSLRNEGMSEIGSKKQAFSKILPELQKALAGMYLDPIHQTIIGTRKRLLEDDGFDRNEAMTVAVKKRKFLFSRMLEDDEIDP